MDSSSQELDEQSNIEQSNIDNNDQNDESDYYNDSNERYKNTNFLPTTEPPKETFHTTNNQKNKSKYSYNYKEEFVNTDEKFEKIKNFENTYGNQNENFPEKNPEHIFENFKVPYSETFDYKSTSYDNFSKDHLRESLLNALNKIDWKNEENKINEAKKETNAYEDINEHYFDKKQAYQLANINYLFEKELIKKDNLLEGISVFLVGDNGGFADYIMYFTIFKNGFDPKIFCIPEKNNLIKNAKFRKEINDKKEECIEILNEFYEEKRDFDENNNLSLEMINKISDKIDEKTEPGGINLYIARKVIKYIHNESQEMKYRKFFLINTLLAFKMLNNGGNYIIKLYDTFTPFTIGIIYMIFKNFEQISIFKPVSTRQYSSCRYLVAEKFIGKEENKSIKYLETFVQNYIEFTKDKNDVLYFLLISELNKNKYFVDIIYGINNGITEKRIDALQELYKKLNGERTKLYDKMSIKKFFLDNWKVPVLVYDEKKLLKNTLFNNDNKNRNNYKNHNNNHIHKNYDEYADECGEFNNFNKSGLAMINAILGQKDKNKNKQESKVHKKKEEQKTLADKYASLTEKMGNKKKTSVKKEKDGEFLQKKRKRKNEEVDIIKSKEKKSETKNANKNNNAKDGLIQQKNHKELSKDDIRKKLEIHRVEKKDE